jgi:hypothetical protein
MKTQWDYSKEMFSNFSYERLVLMRNFCLGGAAATLLILIGAYQVGVRDIRPLMDWFGRFDGWVPDGFPWDTAGGNVAVIAGAIALPFWVAATSLWEYYIFLGKEYLADFKVDGIRLYISLIMFIAAVGLLVAVGGMLMHLGKLVFIVFAWASVAALVVFYVFHGIFVFRHRKKSATRANRNSH